MATAPKDPTAIVGQGKLARRKFLFEAGNTALAAPLTTSLIISAAAVPAVAKSPYGGSDKGRGHGRGRQKSKHAKY